MKNYTEEEVQEIVLRSVMAGYDCSAEGDNSEIQGSAFTILEKAIKLKDPSCLNKAREFTEVVNAILKELNVQEIK